MTSRDLAGNPDCVPADDVVDPEERGRVLTAHLVVPGIVNLLVRDGQERRVLLENLLRLAHHGLAPAVVRLALDLTSEVVEGRVGTFGVDLGDVLAVPGGGVVGRVP